MMSPDKQVKNEFQIKDIVDHTFNLPHGIGAIENVEAVRATLKL
jgi:hypothetical protein